MKLSFTSVHVRPKAEKRPRRYSKLKNLLLSSAVLTGGLLGVSCGRSDLFPLRGQDAAPAKVYPDAAIGKSNHDAGVDIIPDNKPDMQKPDAGADASVGKDAMPGDGATCFPVIGTGSLPAFGNPANQVKLVVFTDFECPYCQKLVSDALLNVRQNYVPKGKVVIYHRDFPLTFHQLASTAAQGARCANEQGKFWSMYDTLFTNQSEWAGMGLAAFLATLNGYAVKLGLAQSQFDTCVLGAKYTDDIMQDFSEGQSYSVNGTPTSFILIPKGADVDMAAISAVVKQSFGGILSNVDCQGNLVVTVNGSFGYSSFQAILDAVK